MTSGHGSRVYDFICRNLKGKTVFAGKPGIAIAFDAEDIPGVIEKHRHIPLVPVAIPADAAKRWHARKSVPSWRQQNSRRYHARP